MSKLDPRGLATVGRCTPPMSRASSGTLSAAKPNSSTTSTYSPSRSFAPRIPSNRE